MYGFLHSWLNMWAEMLQFADRHFYDAWWLSSSYGEYYRKWNAVVHVWLHTYIYNPLNKVNLTNLIISIIATCY